MPGFDVGCGVGASIYLARRYGAKATGITISAVRVEMANKAAATAGVDARFLLMDAETMTFDKSFDVVVVESISHYQDIPKFFTSAANPLKPGGTLAITDWFKRKGLTPREHKKFLHHREMLNENCAKTWDFCLDIIKDKSLWGLAAQLWPGIRALSRAFKRHARGIRLRQFVYGLMVAKRPEARA